MQKPQYRSALIVGTGPGLSSSLARLFAREGLAVAVAARQTDKLAGLAKETGAAVHACNAAEPAAVAELFAKHGLAVSLAARQTDKLAALTKETGAEAHDGLDRAARARPDFSCGGDISCSRRALPGLGSLGVARHRDIRRQGVLCVGVV